MLPHLKLRTIEKISTKEIHYHYSKTTEWEVCRECPTKFNSVHSRRSVSIRYVKIHNKYIKLIITKRRFGYPCCDSVFNEATDVIVLKLYSEPLRNIVHKFSMTLEILLQINLLQKICATQIH